MTSKSPSSLKDFYRSQIHNNNSNPAKSSYKRQLDSSDNASPSFKIPRSIDHGIDLVTLEDSDEEDSQTNEFLPVRGISTPSPGALPFGIEETFNSPEDPAKDHLFKIFFLKTKPKTNTQNSDMLRSAYNSLSREVFNPRWIDISKIDEMISRQEMISAQPVIVLDSFDSSEFSLLKSKNCLKIFSAFALLQVNPRKSGDLTSFEHSCIASLCMKKVSLTFSGITDHNFISRIRRRVRQMGGTFKPALYGKTTHIIATNWNSEKVKYFRKVNKPVMLPEWVFRCWEKREEISDLHELDDFALPVFAGMNVCVSGFNQQDRTAIRKMVEKNGGNWQSGLILDRYDFDSEDTQTTQIDPTKKTTHLVVKSKSGDKYKAAMSDPDVKIVNRDWVTLSQLQGIPQMEDDPKYCLRDENALKELKRLERENKRKQLQGSSQNSATSTQNNSVPILPPKKDVTIEIEKLALTNMISSTDVFDGLSFCFSGLASKYLPHVKKIISRLGGTVYNELVSSVTHVIIGNEINSRDAYNLNRHEEKYGSISKVDLNWIVACADHGSLFPSQCDDKLENFIEQIKCTQDLPPSEAKEIAYARALKSADEFVKEIDFVEKLNRNSNFNKAKNNNNNNNHTAAINGLRMGAVPVSPKLKILTKDLHSQRGSITASIPVGWGSQPTD